MKATLLFFVALAGVSVQAQTTHMVDWFMGVSMDETTITIDAGDTVIWTWMDGAPHTVTTGPTADTAFDSGMLTGNGQTFSFTFPDAGVSSYACNFHPMMMGTITVEDGLGTPQSEHTSFRFFPNPVSDVLTISDVKNIGKIAVFDATGKKLFEASADTPEARIYFANYPSGQYVVKTESRTFSVVKR